MKLLDQEKTGLLVIDVQEKLMAVMGRKQEALDNIIKLLHLAKLYNLPVILTEQNPKWLGSTLSGIRVLLPSY
jgi:nicotinamidase-related amidase